MYPGSSSFVELDKGSVSVSRPQHRGDKAHKITLEFVGCRASQLGLPWEPTLESPTSEMVEALPLGVNDNVVMLLVYEPARIKNDVAATILVVQKGGESICERAQLLLSDGEAYTSERLKPILASKTTSGIKELPPFSNLSSTF